MLDAVSDERPGPLDRMRDPDADPARDRARLRAAAMMAGMGIAHFLVPGPFRRIVPRWFPWRREAVMVSGVAEIASGALLAIPRTRRAGGWLMLLTVLAVYPANVQAALDGGMKGMDPPLDSAAAAWIRLPFQFPLFWLAWRVVRDTTPVRAAAVG